MRPDQQSISTGTIMAENTQSRLRHIMEASGPPDPSDSENFQKLETAYGACLNESTIQKRGTKPLDDMLAGMAKIYSPSSNKGVKDGLTDAIVYLMKTGTTAFVEYEIGVSSLYLNWTSSDFEGR